MNSPDNSAAKIKKLAIGLIGATGYTGAEVLRLLAAHPAAELVAAAASDGSSGQQIDAIWPHLAGFDWPDLIKADDPAFNNCDLVFMATTNGIAMNLAPPLIRSGVRIIDLSADFRLRDENTRRKWYGDAPHSSSELLQQAVYGLPELFAEKITKAKLVANPGCFPTAVVLALAPLLKASLIDPGATIVDAKSGTSGAGRGNAPRHAEVSDSICAYAATGHRHAPEMIQSLRDYAGGDSINLIFVPHLAPMRRGILATIYVRLQQGVTADTVKANLQKAYSDSPFVKLAHPGECPATTTVVGGNMCRLAVHQQDCSPDTVILMSVIDNLVKGAAGQAIQNMNLMFQLPQQTGLPSTGMVP